MGGDYFNTAGGGACPHRFVCTNGTVLFQNGVGACTNDEVHQCVEGCRADNEIYPAESQAPPESLCIEWVPPDAGVDCLADALCIQDAGIRDATVTD
jgi:hypothetical protein